MISYSQCSAGCLNCQSFTRDLNPCLPSILLQETCEDKVPTGSFYLLNNNHHCPKNAAYTLLYPIKCWNFDDKILTFSKLINETAGSVNWKWDSVTSQGEIHYYKNRDCEQLLQKLILPKNKCLEFYNGEGKMYMVATNTFF